MIYLVSLLSVLALFGILVFAIHLALSFDLDEESIEEWEDFKEAFEGNK
jgi:hypothetical protein